ncbi:hypothetical protein X802_06575 [Thermococcus guaymasensis DSM 11113]|uniref:Uncharacterized protein n=1 Tax=Thermococcus guaymasensis DSM 11113 TaxID=1432656 RepID=A0A0X1KND7_9EURY|nr:hypothetical protein X802_06575 [Thermococcus guaymasensis DSM 11113]
MRALYIKLIPFHAFSLAIQVFDAYPAMKSFEKPHWLLICMRAIPVLNFHFERKQDSFESISLTARKP